MTLLSDCKPAIRVVEKLDLGTEAPRSSIEARNQHALETREGHQGLHRIGKADTDKCRCGEMMTGTHVVPELDQWRPRRAQWADLREALGGRAMRKEKEKEAPEEEEVDQPVYIIFTNFFPPLPLVLLWLIQFKMTILLLLLTLFLLAPLLLFTRSLLLSCFCFVFCFLIKATSYD